MGEIADLGMPYMENYASVLSVVPCVTEHATMYARPPTIAQLEHLLFISAYIVALITNRLNPRKGSGNYHYPPPEYSKSHEAVNRWISSKKHARSSGLIKGVTPNGIERKPLMLQ